MRRPSALLALALLSGCTLLLPGRADKAASFAPFEGETISGVPLARYLRLRSCAIVSNPQVVTGAAQPEVEADGCGTAIPIAADGYLLTAAHCIAAPPSFVLVEVGGRMGLVEARVVWAGDPDG